MNRKLYVGNLPFQTTENELEALFAPSGDVASVTVMRDRETGRARGFAFVEMASDEGATHAVATLNNSSYGGRSLSVNEARPQEARREGFGGPRGGHRSEPRW
jgi:RNA recognition motif-containing protein